MQPSIRSTAGFDVVGLELRTSNAQAFQTIPAHWARVTAEGWLARITGRHGSDVYAVYTDFAHPGQDNAGIYSLVIGAAVDTDAPVPDGMRRVAVPAARRAVFPVEPARPEQVGAAWQVVWAAHDLPKSYLCDYEHYAADGRIDLCIGLR